MFHCGSCGRGGVVCRTELARRSLCGGAGLQPTAGRAAHAKGNSTLAGLCLPFEEQEPNQPERSFVSLIVP